jgi:hypothetical protein
MPRHLALPVSQLRQQTDLTDLLRFTGQAQRRLKFLASRLMSLIKDKDHVKSSTKPTWLTAKNKGLRNG